MGLALTLTIRFASRSMLYSRRFRVGLDFMLNNDRITHWARLLRAWGLDHLMATLLENAGPLAWLGAQGVYVARPMLGLVWPDTEWNALAEWLEKPETLPHLAHRLAEETLA